MDSWSRCPRRRHGRCGHCCHSQLRAQAPRHAHRLLRLPHCRHPDIDCLHHRHCAVHLRAQPHPPRLTQCERHARSRLLLCADQHPAAPHRLHHRLLRPAVQEARRGGLHALRCRLQLGYGDEQPHCRCQCFGELQHGLDQVVQAKSARCLPRVEELSEKGVKLWWTTARREVGEPQLVEYRMPRRYAQMCRDRRIDTRSACIHESKSPHGRTRPIAGPAARHHASTSRLLSSFRLSASRLHHPRALFINKNASPNADRGARPKFLAPLPLLSFSLPFVFPPPSASRTIYTPCLVPIGSANLS